MINNPRMDTLFKPRLSDEFRYEFKEAIRAVATAAASYQLVFIEDIKDVPQSVDIWDINRISETLLKMYKDIQRLDAFNEISKPKTEGENND